MRILLLSLSCIMFSWTSFAADGPELPEIPAKLIAEKKELLFSDDFEGAERDKRWHRVVKSPGIGHATKSKIELGVAGQSGWFDDIKIWNAAPVK